MIDIELFNNVFNRLKEKNLTISSIESFTGGLYSSTFTSIPGVSSVFKGAIVTYWTEIKEDVLLISKDIIDKYTVVSGEVAYEMAEKGNKILKSDITISFTGNAGPSVCDGDKPVGLFYIGINYLNKINTYEFYLKDKSRQEIREQALNLANKILLEILEK